MSDERMSRREEVGALLDWNRYLLRRRSQVAEALDAEPTEQERGHLLREATRLRGEQSDWADALVYLACSDGWNAAAKNAWVESFYYVN